MNRVSRVILSLGLLGIAFGTGPGVDEALAQKPSNNMWTRSAALYLDRAQNNPRPEDKRELYQQALEASLEGIKNDGGNPRVWFMAGQAYAKLGQYVAADSMFDRAEEIYPDYKEEVDRERLNAWVTSYNTGVNALQAGNTEQAIELLTAANTIYQGRPEAPLNLGSVYARQNEFDKAVDYYRQALAILRGPEREKLNEQREAQWQENEEIASFNLAQILANQGKDEEAAQAYRDFLARNPDDITAKINMAVVLTRMQNEAEAARLYNELLDTEGLSSDNYFRIGLGLFTSEQYDRSAAAFRSALETNTYFRDALYNLGQAIYAQTQAIEQQRMEGAVDSAQAVTRLTELYHQLDSVSTRVEAQDPNNKNVILLHAQAFRGLADLAVDDAASQQLRRKALALLERQEAMPFEVLSVQMAPVQEGKTTIRGMIRNATLEAGTPVTLRFILLDDAGAELSSQQVTVSAPAQEGDAVFEVELEAPGEVSGWKYEVVG